MKRLSQNIRVSDSRILKIINKALPLVKDFKPTLDSLIKINKNTANLSKFIKYDTEEQEKKKEELHNNSLTFFN